MRGLNAPGIFFGIHSRYRRSRIRPLKRSTRLLKARLPRHSAARIAFLANPPEPTPGGISGDQPIRSVKLLHARVN